MSKFEPISFEDFSKALALLHAPVKGHEVFLYSIYSYTVEGISDLADENSFGNLQGINHLELIGYCVGEYTYFVYGLKDEKIKQLQEDENYLVSVSSKI